MEDKISTHHELISIPRNWHRTWKVYSEHFLKFLAVTIIPILVFNFIYWLAVGSTVISLEGLRNPFELFSISNGFVYFILILLFAATFIYILGAIALFVMAGNYDQYGIIKIFRQSVDYFWSFVLMSILIGIVELLGIIVGYLLVTALSAIIGLINQTAMYFIFDYLLVIPFIITSVLSIFLVFAPFLLVLKGETAWQSVKKSFILVKGHFWAVVIRLLTVYIAVSVIFIALGFIPAVGVTLGALICLPFLIIYTMVLFNNIYTLKKVE
ncbi:hypothetical protein KKC88_03280 [Patescibacteria group bacterium]|nr:hypothetical protein [Patescibacteria group bacterium]MBU1673005.1 hypothetical protein [Patescibacteria group bacterium]MBU1964164.1 hypothetical protein [Patescibacteria group bacterium]